jgi:thymidylate synthase (FAD)
MHTEKSTLSSQNIPQQTFDPLQDGIGSIDLVRVSGSDVDIVNAARVSYGKFVTEITEKDTALIRFLLTHEHTSPFEHNQLSFRIKAPIFVVRQWMRHRMNSYNEISYRYVKAPLEFYIPPYFRYQDLKNKQASVGAFKDSTLADQYTNLIHQSVKTYELLLENGVCRELARGVLPLCTYTQFIFTTNLHSLMHFMRLRLHAGAQHEIRMFARGLFYLAKPHFPVSLQVWQEKYKELLTIEEDLFTQQFTEAIEK